MKTAPHSYKAAIFLIMSDMKLCGCYLVTSIHYIKKKFCLTVKY